MELSPFVLEPGRAFIARVAAFLPSLLGALLILLFGWLLARFARLLVFRLLLAVRFDLASDRAGIDADLLSQILLYVPKVIAAVVVLILGLFFASFLGGLVKAAAANAGLGEAEVLASLARYAIVAFTAAVTLEELGIAPDLVRSAFVILFGAVALGLALAFGLGCQDLARDWLTRYLDSARTRKKS